MKRKNIISEPVWELSSYIAYKADKHVENSNCNTPSLDEQSLGNVTLPFEKKRKLATFNYTSAGISPQHEEEQDSNLATSINIENSYNNNIRTHLSNSIASYSSNTYYSSKKIEKLLKAQLAGNRFYIKLIDFKDNRLSKEVLQELIIKVIQLDKPIIVPIHLHSNDWAGMVIKKQKEDSLQLIYNDPAGNSWTKEKHVKSLISTIIDLYSEVNLIDLKYKQQELNNDSEVLIVENLARLATADTLRLNKPALQTLLLTSEHNNIESIRMKHALLLDTNLYYSKYKIEKLLSIELSSKQNTIISVDIENMELPVKELQSTIQNALNTDKLVIMPIHLGSKNWAGMVIKNQEDERLQVIYNNPQGRSLTAVKGLKPLLSAIMDINLEVNIIDLKQKQQSNSNDSGVFIIEDLVLLATNDTTLLSKVTMQKLLQALDADELRIKHITLLSKELSVRLHEYVDNTNSGLNILNIDNELVDISYYLEHIDLHNSNMNSDRDMNQVWLMGSDHKA